LEGAEYSCNDTRGVIFDRCWLTVDCENVPGIEEDFYLCVFNHMTTVN